MPAKRTNPLLQQLQQVLTAKFPKWIMETDTSITSRIIVWGRYQNSIMILKKRMVKRYVRFPLLTAMI